MSDVDSTPVVRTGKGKREKPAKPHKDWPLFPHGSGQWAKKIWGRMHYFGRWEEPEKAMELWLHQKDDLLARRTPSPLNTDALTVKRLCDLFLESKEAKVATGERSQRTWDDYHTTALEVAKQLGRNIPVENLRPDDFKRLRTYFARA